MSLKLKGDVYMCAEQVEVDKAAQSVETAEVVFTAE